MERVSTLGVMAAITSVSGSQTRCMEAESSGGPMVVYTKVILSMIVKKAREFLLGLMDACMKDHGPAASKTALVISQMSKALRQRDNGLRARSNVGSTIEMSVCRLIQQQNNLLSCFRLRLALRKCEVKILDLQT